VKKVIIVLALSFVFMSCRSCNDNKSNKPLPPVEANKSPIEPYQQRPEENENVLPNVRLTWNCYDTDGDPLLYDLYINGKLTAASISNQFYEIKLKCGLTYEWFVVAKDNKGNKTDGPKWIFNTKPLVYIAEFVVVSASNYINRKMVLDKGDKIRVDITSDTALNVWLMSEIEFIFFVRQEQFNFFREGSSKQIKSFKSDFIVPESGEYRLVLDNRFSLFTNKNVSVFVYKSHYR